MIFKKYCIDYDSDVEKVEVEIEKNKIKCKDLSGNFYKIYIWQQIEVNKILEKYSEAILEIEFVDIDYIKTMTIKNKFEIPKTRVISGQCMNCKNRVNCKEFQEALVKDYVLETKTPDKLYNTYIAIGAKIEALTDVKEELRAAIDKLIIDNNNKLILGNLGLTLSIKEIQRDDFPFQVALDNKLLNEKNCKIKMSEFKKSIQETDFVKYIKKVPWQKRLNIE